MARLRIQAGDVLLSVFDSFYHPGHLKHFCKEPDLYSERPIHAANRGLRVKLRSRPQKLLANQI